MIARRDESLDRRDQDCWESQLQDAACASSLVLPFSYTLPCPSARELGVKRP